MAETTLTILNSMAGIDFAQALRQHAAWGIRQLDLKDAIFGKQITDLTLEEADHVAQLIQARGMSVYCLSTGLFHGNIEQGEAFFRQSYLSRLPHVLGLASVLKPRLIRLLAAHTPRRGEIQDSVRYLQAGHPWLMPLYREAVQHIADAGFGVTIENEVGNCILATPAEILGFFASLDCGDQVCLTWDVQNLWQMGTYPSMEVYQQLKPLIGFYHLKGGQQATDRHELLWRSSLEDASWPVVEVTQQVVEDGVSPVICLNPSHGKPKEGYDYSNLTERDLKFVRRNIPEVI